MMPAWLAGPSEHDGDFQVEVAVGDFEPHHLFPADAGVEQEQDQSGIPPGLERLARADPREAA